MSHVRLGRFEIELQPWGLFLRLPLIGEAFIGRRLWAWSRE